MLYIVFCRQGLRKIINLYKPIYINYLIFLLIEFQSAKESAKKTVIIMKKYANEDYELLPINELEELKQKLSHYTASKNPIKGEIEDLKGSMSRLSDQLKTVNEIFQTAQEEVELEKKQQEFIQQTMTPLMAKVNDIENENKIIATAILNVVDIMNEHFAQIRGSIESLKSKMQGQTQQPAFHQTSAVQQAKEDYASFMQQPSFEPKPRMTMPPQMSAPELTQIPEVPRPSLQSQQARKKGMFSDLFK